MSKAEAVKFLTKDEVEALAGYESKMKYFSPEEQKIIRKIMADEAEHIIMLDMIGRGVYETKK